jgi:hypothetical protein
MITDEKFIEATKRFDEIEKRGSFYNMALTLFDNNFEMEAYFLILATWNFAVFRYAIKDFDIDGFKKKIRELNDHFEIIKNEKLKTIDLNKYKEDIKKIYETLADIKGIQFTGASKIMHIRNRNVFVMWDGYIRGTKPKKYYNELEIVKNGSWQFRKYNKNGEGYFQFLKDMQERFKNINFHSVNKSFAKAIDEYNYMNITMQIQEKENRMRVR